MAESRQRRWGAGALSEQAVSEGKSAGRVGAEQVGHRVVLGMPPCREEEPLRRLACRAVGQPRMVTEGGEAAGQSGLPQG